MPKKILVIDDGSRDQTATLAESTGDARIEVIRHGVNRGLGVFTITPQLGTTYSLKLEHPAKVATCATVCLPSVIAPRTSTACPFVFVART